MLLPNPAPWRKVIHEAGVHRKLPVPHACTPAYRFVQHTTAHLPYHLGTPQPSIPRVYCPQHSSDAESHNPQGHQHPTHHHDLQAEFCTSSPEEVPILSLGSSQTQTFSLKPCHFPGSPVDSHTALHKASATDQKHPPPPLLPSLQEVNNFSLGASGLGPVRTSAPAQHTQGPGFHPQDHERYNALTDS